MKVDFFVHHYYPYRNYITYEYQAKEACPTDVSLDKTDTRV